jgi:PhoD related phosphatase/WW domain
LTHTPSLLAAATSPPPLPEGWIAHLDQNSGQYYYIHLATQATQWEFPKGPNPLHHETAPLSPTASTYGNPLASPLLGGGKAGLASPMFHPQTPGYAESIMSVAASATPSTAGFTGPPPSAGIDMYKVMPTNGVYFGPYLRYVNMDLEKGTWLGSILIVTDAPQPPTIHLHLSVDLSPDPRQLVPRNIYSHQRWIFYKYDMSLQMSEHGSERWTYAVTSHLGCTRYEFVVAGRYETGWRMIAHSNNDFAPSTNQNERAKLGGVGFMWKDILQKNVECGGFHVQLGLGDQIYGDRLWREVPLLKQWLGMQGRENRKNAPWTARHEEDTSHAYFHYYTSHFDQPFMREAFAQIPHVLQIDDHDM